MRAGLVLGRGCEGEVKRREGREVRGMGIVQRDFTGIVGALGCGREVGVRSF